MIMIVYFMKELEAACAKWKHVSFDDGAILVRWRLPASKSDQQALSVSRTWGCICSPPGQAPVPCAYHDLLWLRGAAERRFGQVSPDLPVFADRHGRHCKKEAVVETIRRVAIAAGETAVSAEGAWIHSGHTPRSWGVSGWHPAG